MDIENEIHETEKQLVKMIDELDGSEYDLKGLGELKALLMGGNMEKKKKPAIRFKGSLILGNSVSWGMWSIE